MTDPQTAPDPHRWLEEVESPEALAWVGRRSAATETALASGERYRTLHADLQDALEAAARASPSDSRNTAM